MTNWQEFSIPNVTILTIFIITLVLSNWLVYDQSASDGPKGIGFPFAFYIGGGGLCPDKSIPEGVTCPFNFYYEPFLIDLIIWIVISICTYFLVLLIHNKIKKK